MLTHFTLTIWMLAAHAAPSFTAAWFLYLACGYSACIYTARQERKGDLRD